MDLSIYWTDTSSMLAQNELLQMIETVPAPIRARALRYKSDLSACNYVTGRLLIKHGLEANGHDSDLNKIRFEENGKPTIPGVHFNISHSDHQVICAFANEGRLGVDLEKIKPIDFADFESMFSAREWEVIKGDEEPLAAFYWFWTRKESIIKALGLTLSYVHQIDLDVSKDDIVINGKRWYLKHLDYWEGFVGAVCSEEEIEDVELLHVSF